MTDDKWQEIVEMAQKNFRGAKLSHEDLIVQKGEGSEKQGTCDILEFEHSNGDRYKLVRENKPVVLEKKELYSHRAGQAAQAQYKFSETELYHKLKVYKEVDFEWQEISLDKLGF
jgi:hypothetical protein